MKYIITIEYETPYENKSQQLFAEMHVRKALTEYLNSLEEQRRRALTNLFKVGISTVSMDTTK